MEIHRRSRPSKTLGNDPSNNEAGALPSSPRGARSKKNYTPAVNPYNAASSTIADVILLRSIQVLMLLVAAWFLYLIAAVADPSLDITPLGVDGDGSGLRGPSTMKLPSNLAATDPKDVAAARGEITRLRDEFYSRYGGKEVAMAMQERGLRTFENKSGNTANNSGGSVRSTANRFLASIVRHETSQSTTSTKPEFVMAFAGYSVTVGRGNHLKQSYPFILEHILSPILQLPPLNIKLIVRNSAIGGIPSFPYGWCLPNFLGEDADLVSWDYGMNEGNGAEGLESYVRQSLMMPKSPPLFVLLDSKRQRLDVLQEYVDLGLLPDPIALGNKAAVDKQLLKLPEGDRPPGLQNWEEWGAPKGSPGQSPWHPRKMEHELMGWMMAMHMLDALDVALEVMDQDVNWRTPILAQELQAQHESTGVVILPPPATKIRKTEAASLLYGSASNAGEWHMNHISCRTSFLPNISGDLNSIIESGVATDKEDMLQSRDDALFNGGWVMDVGKVERETKLKVLKIGGLGYIDMKTALYGIPSSGALKLWVPYEGPAKSSIKPGDSASKYFKAAVLCEVNEKRGDNECKMMSDLDFRVGDAVVSKGNVSQIKGIASYLKKDICIRVEIPGEAKMSHKSGGGTEFGLALEITVAGTGVSRENGACSISHVIWENQ